MINFYHFCMVAFLALQCWIMIFYYEKHSDYLSIICHRLTTLNEKITALQNQRK